MNRFYVDPGLPLEEPLRTVISNSLKSDLEELHPKMLSRLKELGPLATDELGSYADFMLEARNAFLYGLWRSVVALVGVAAESFIDELYDNIKWVAGPTGMKMAKTEVFGKDPTQKTKVQVLKLYELITPAVFDKLLKIKDLRDRYLHADVQGRDIGTDARDAINLLNSVLSQRFASRYEFRDGAIVRRSQDGAPST